MSNYYLNSNTVKLSDVAKYITDTNVANAYVGNGLTANTSVFTTSVTENPNNFNYKYNGTDISTYCIAAYVESSGSNTFSSIPAWCKNIRAILIGGGGGGSQHYYNFDAHRNQNNNRNNSEEHDNNNNDQHQHISGAGGGGGGFIYLKTTLVTSVSIQVGSGGGPANPGGNTILTTSAGTFSAYGGGGGTRTVVSGISQGVGGDGGITTQVTNGAYNNGTAGTKTDNQTFSSTVTDRTFKGGVGGNAGTQNTYTTNTDILNYGKGGDGVSITYRIDSSQQQWGTHNAPTSTQAATSGSGGYYRIYFLQ
jgi:hypothetical protein